MPTAPVNVRFITGATVGLNTLAGLLFDPDKPFTGCRVCGAIYQSPQDRRYGDTEVTREGRRLWSVVHSRRHLPGEHVALAKSGKWCTPEAAKELAAFGVITLDDGDEYVAALLESNPIPTNDAEGN